MGSRTRIDSSETWVTPDNNEPMKESGGVMDFPDGIKLGGTLITPSAAEINILTGVTATAAEINKLP